jgi:hypothetical protein
MFGLGRSTVSWTHPHLCINPKPKTQITEFEFDAIDLIYEIKARELCESYLAFSQQRAIIVY